MAAHAEYSPSSANRWMICTASVALIADMRRRGLILSDVAPEDVEEHTAEGTMMHDVRAACLTRDLDPFSWVGTEITTDGHEFMFDEDMAEALLPGIDWLRQQLDEIEVERRVRLDPWLPGQFGTLDSGGLFDDVLIINDYKNGIGLKVDAVDNKQLRLYALGLWHAYGRPQVRRILIVVDQPRLGGLKPWAISLADLLEFGRQVSEIYLRIHNGDVEFNPSQSACQFCEAKDTTEGCPAYNRMMMDTFLGAFDRAMLLMGPYDLPHPDTVDPDIRWQILRHRTAAKAWLDKLYADSLAAATNGAPDPGSKPVRGKPGNRFLRNLTEAEAILVDALGPGAWKPRELLSVTQIEKLMKPGKRKEGDPFAWPEISALIDREPGKPTLADETDPRTSILSMDAEFDDLD